MKTKLYWGIILLSLLLVYPLLMVMKRPLPLYAAGFIVDTSADDLWAHDANPGDGLCADQLGSCTLRAAIEEANALPGHDTVTFSSPMTITISPDEGQLPTITGQLDIDASGVWDLIHDKPGVILNGGGQNFSGLVLMADSCHVYGLYIRNFNFNGISVRSGYNNIGGAEDGRRNVISGNGLAGIDINGSAGQNNFVVNNFIGVSPSGTAKEPNIVGISLLDGAASNVIGGYTTLQGNLIAGNTEHGIVVGGSGTNGNILGGNVIGGTPTLGNGRDGVSVHTNAGHTIIGGSNYPGNTISGNGESGIYVSTVTGTTRAEFNTIYENGDSGITIFGANVWVISNTISANNDAGIIVSGAAATGNWLTQNSVYNNGWIGIDLISGGNTELAAPVITSAAPTGAMGTACVSCTVELFSSSDGEGQTYEGVTTADANGNWTYNGSLGGPLATAIATDGNKNSSEFSFPSSVASPPSPSYKQFLPFVTK